MNKLTLLKERLFGNPNEISSERYVFTFLLFVVMVFAIVRCIFHLISTLSFETAIISGAASLVFFALYYSVRIYKWLLAPKIIITSIGFVVLDLTWYFQSLSKGPIMFLIIIFAALLVWVWNGKQLLWFITVYVLNTLMLFYIDYTSIGGISVYPNQQIRSVHIFLSFFSYVAVLTIALYLIKKEFLRLKQNAINSERLKSAFLANMSHEIRTPMNGILGFSNLLKSQNLSGEIQEEYIEMIARSGHRMLGVVDDIVDMSKLEANLVELNIQDSNITEQLEYVYKFFKPEAEAKGLAISCKNMDLNIAVTIKTDREKLFAILINLVKNAIKYTNTGTITIGYSLEGKCIKFYVQDTGIGIAKNRQKAVFERFVQADIEDVQARQGAGLGLTITKSYVTLLGGEIWMESEQGRGSIFYFKLPYNPTTKEAQINTKDMTEEIQTTEKRKLKILIVEDDEISEMLLKITIKDFCAEPLIARSGKEAVTLAKNNPDLDLILMDIKLPIISGHEATRQIRKFNKEVIIIAQTAYALSSDREKAVNSGCNDYLTKPIDKVKLGALITTYLG